MSCQIEKSEIYEIVDETIHIKKRFVELWNILRVNGTFLYLGNGVIRDIAGPTNDTSLLVGSPTFRDPVTSVRLYSFDMMEQKGPIRNGGYFLNTFNSLLILKISWWVVGENLAKNVKVGFYSTDDYHVGSPSELILITGSKGPSLFNANDKNRWHGCFKAQNINNIFVASDAEVEIRIKIRSIIPESIKIPYLAPGVPHNIMLTSSLCCEKINLNVAQQVFVPGENGVAVQTPTRNFLEASRYVQKFLAETALSLYVDDENSTTLVVPHTIINYSGMTFRMSVLRYMDYMTLITNDLFPGSDQGIQYLGGDFYGVKLNEYIKNLPPSGRIQPYYTVSFSFKLKVTGAPPSESFYLSVRFCGYNGIWNTHTQVNPETGLYTSDAVIEYGKIPYDVYREYEGSISLSQYDQPFNITVDIDTKQRGLEISYSQGFEFTSLKVEIFPPSQAL